MTNSICLSSDMNKVYLIDDERAISFDLTKNNGILVGLIRDQLTVVTAARPMPNTVPGKTVNRISFPTTDSQFTLVYHSDHTTMFIMGVLDIDSAITLGNEPPTRVKSINLSKGAVNIKRTTDKIELVYLA